MSRSQWQVDNILNTSKSAFDGRILWIIWLDKNKENGWGRRWDFYGRKYSLFHIMYRNNFTVCLTAFCTIGRYLWHSSADSTLWLWGPTTGLHMLKVHTNAIAFSKDACISIDLLISGDHTTVRLWGPTTPIGYMQLLQRLGNSSISIWTFPADISGPYS
jgi:hypothetical protein